MSKKIKLNQLKQDDKNFNRHTESGMHLLEESIDKVGVIESITVSADDKIISGNARQKIMNQKFNGVEPIVVETDGSRPVILKRTDIAGESKEFHEAALLANTVAKKNINLDLDLIQAVAVEEYGLDIDELGVDPIAYEPAYPTGGGTAARGTEDNDEMEMDWSAYGGDSDDLESALTNMQKGVKKAVILEFDLDEFEQIEPLVSRYRKEGNLSWFLADKLREHYGK